MSYFLPYLIVFVVGPLVFLVLLRVHPSFKFTTILAVAVVVLTITAWAIKQSGPVGNMMAMLMLLALWLGWISALATCARVICTYYTSQNIRRWSAVIGAMATTIPWLGYSAASYVGS